MNLRCKIFGHKTVRGDIETYGEAFDCVRCGKQLIYPETDIAQRTLRGRADTIEQTGYSLSGMDNVEEEKVYEHLDKAKRFRRAADLLDGNPPSNFGELKFTVTGEEGKDLDPTQEIGVYIDGELVDMTIVDMMWKPLDRDGENVLIDITAMSDKARELKHKR